ncbi:MAG: guanylate kinase [Alphaproteobacteria bacterium]|nr:guanylate kinase [Alphaproteobacteria bacterium]
MSVSPCIRPEVYDMDKLVLVFSGFSGAGKSTLINHLLSELGDDASLTVSCTTRAPREGEHDGVDYHFISHDKFDQLVRCGEFLEHVQYCGNRYGTLKSAVNDVLRNKKICILDLEFEGAYSVLHGNAFDFPCVGILILPPSLRSLEKRLRARHSETEESLKLRLTEAFQPKRIAKYHHVIVNRNLESAKVELLQIVKSYIAK